MKSRSKTALILIASTLFANLIQDDTAVLFQEFLNNRKSTIFSFKINGWVGSNIDVYEIESLGIGKSVLFLLNLF